MAGRIERHSPGQRLVDAKDGAETGATGWPPVIDPANRIGTPRIVRAVVIGPNFRRHTMVLSRRGLPCRATGPPESNLARESPNVIRVHDRTVEYIRHGDTPYMMKLLQAQWRWAVSDGYRFAWWGVVQWRSRRLRRARSGAGGERTCCRGGQLSSRGRRLSDVVGRISISPFVDESECREVEPAAPRRLACRGTSSGGHLAMLAAMRPSDPRYTAVASPAGGATDATVQSGRDAVAGDQSPLPLSQCARG